MIAKVAWWIVSHTVPENARLRVWKRYFWPWLPRGGA
jgi:hypothetical protein